MSENPGQARRRYRRRATAAQGPAAPSKPPPPATTPTPVTPEPAASPDQPARSEIAAEAAPRRRRPPPRESGERGLRDLVGAGNSQLGVSGALRGRDVNRPTDEDLAEAERDVVIIRRNWKPDDKR